MPHSTHARSEMAGWTHAYAATSHSDTRRPQRRGDYRSRGGLTVAPFAKHLPGWATYGGFVFDATRGDVVAERFGLGEHASMEGPVAFGRLGEIWRLVAERGRFAVKHPQFAVS